MKNLNYMKKCAVFCILTEDTCVTHWAIKYFLLKIIYTGQLSVLIFYFT